MTPPSSGMDDTPITTSELFRMMREVKETIKDVREHMDDYPNMRDLANLENRVRDTEETVKWAMRGALVALAGMAFNIILESSRLVS